MAAVYAVNRWRTPGPTNRHRSASQTAATRRCNGHSLDTIIAKVNQTPQGCCAYFKHSHYATFGRHDGWIRMRYPYPYRNYTQVRFLSIFVANRLLMISTFFLT